MANCGSEDYKMAIKALKQCLKGAPDSSDEIMVELRNSQGKLEHLTNSKREMTNPSKKSDSAQKECPRVKYGPENRPVTIETIPNQYDFGKGRENENQIWAQHRQFEGTLDCRDGLRQRATDDYSESDEDVLEDSNESGEMMGKDAEDDLLQEYPAYPRKLIPVSLEKKGFLK